MLTTAQSERYAGILRDVLQREQQGSLEELELVVLITAISAGARRGLLDALWRTPSEILQAVLGPHGTAGALDPATYAQRVQVARDALDLAELLTRLCARGCCAGAWPTRTSITWPASWA